MNDIFHACTIFLDETPLEDHRPCQALLTTTLLNAEIHQQQGIFTYDKHGISLLGWFLTNLNLKYALVVSRRPAQFFLTT